MTDTGGRPPQPPETDEAFAARQQAKQAWVDEALGSGKVQVRLDARHPGVRVPERFADEPALALNLSWQFPNTGMVVNERGLAATLRFGGVSFRCVLPWPAVWGAAPFSSDTSRVWPEDLPPELGGADRTERAWPPVEGGRPSLSVVSPAPAPEAPESEPPPPPEPQPPEPSGGARAPWLRLVRD